MSRRGERTDLAAAVALLAPGAATAGACPHPPTRLYGWVARDDTSPGGRLAPPGQAFCVACCACGVVLQGAGELREPA